ncbi:mannose-1-phosphate guanylyltransferase/mannose-6-phosphate isomerase [Dongia deserti]|uniref:mannose-1-phosphate guanylyltransferase/mannose-6-phosphate isomerase n=1 Tax=Dongia deserti TaxID=2268030 RepID=UPI000E65DC90|nr:mannose-1-phosphate guanylyltransferase/mannose-6-phosphate isomerase [Dongia deserti]
MKESGIRPVVLCGGSGTRLWPLSRTGFPKQFLGLTADESLLQQTLLRVTGPQFAPPIVVGGAEHRFMIADHLHRVGVRPRQIILEPVARNTAAAVALAALRAAEDDPDTLLLILPSDHVIRNVEAFRAGVEAAVKAAKAGYIVTFGIEPTEPSTAYGYILRGERIAAVPGGFKIEKFVEKPDRARAEELITAGSCSWNGGIFLVKAGTYLSELDLHEPAILAACRDSLVGAKTDLDFLRPDAERFAASPNISIDYAVMEKTRKAAVVPVSTIGWSDVGSFAALYDIGLKDNRGNVVQGDVVLQDVEKCFIHAEEKMVAALGVEDLVIVQTDDVLFVSTKDRSQDVKQMVEDLADAGRPQAKLHSTVHRPWGTYRTVAAGDRYQVKRITVKPGCKLSMQFHHHRAEHWVVVRGTARVTCGTEVKLLHENQSTYIPLGEMHRLENPGMLDLELIEVQSGAYLGEDDIVRVDDAYGRTAAE